jgi:membrane protein YdbS with pleckstrin-like domain
MVGLLALLFVFSMALRKAPAWAHDLYAAIVVFILAVVLIAWLATYLALRLEYDLHWYILTDRSLRIRRGIWTVQELTMTFANIQEIRITSGPLQKLLGIADVEVHSAGGGAGGSQAGHPSARRQHVAAFAGVGNADEIRDRIVERLRHYREMGLGGSEPQSSHPTAVDPPAVQAARAVLQEARALRNSFPRH